MCRRIGVERRSLFTPDMSARKRRGNLRVRKREEDEEGQQMMKGPEGGRATPVGANTPLRGVSVSSMVHSPL